MDNNGDSELLDPFEGGDGGKSLERELIRDGMTGPRRSVPA